MTAPMTRRHFLMSAATAAAAPAILRAAPPSERVRVGVVGIGNQGAFNWGELAGKTDAQIVALCDVDERMTAAARKQFPKAVFFTDFRKMIDAKGLDAVLCATPDHNHFHVTHMAMSNGLHAYCEKPLTHTVWEARKLAELAAEKKLVTQMGTQIHAGDNYRRVVEMIRKGVIGPVREVHCWVGGAFNGNGKRPDPESIPTGLDWDQWLGPAAVRPYSSKYVPFYWRRFWAFGGGKMADMACHHMDLPFWALDLRHPTKISAKGSAPTEETGADWIICEYEFPARGELPAVTLTWYDGDKRPKYFAEGKLPKWGDGTLFVGEKGMLLAGYGERKLLPEESFRGVDGDKSIPSSIGHHKEWIEAIKTGGKTTCNFDYSGALTETVLLGVVSYRVGKTLEWDAKVLSAKGVPEADRLIRKGYRTGWEIS
ncbi:MAG TPA: Gfo/Idh/MocA family oxidoreductase [Gemmataceae bacterium]|nr:Gfo/Idh/MocA family oxidoreductase [Gemmataceae bacterium]